MFLSVFTTFLCGFLSLKLDLFSHGIFTLPQDQQNFLIQMCYLEAFLLISAQMFILLFEMEDRYKMYLESRTLLNSQSRLSDLGVMTAGIAHEINNPLSIVSGLAQLGLSRTKRNNITKEIHTDNYEKIIHQTKRITKIISGLKFISRDGKKDPFETQFIDKPIIEACELCKTKLDSKNIKSFLHLKEKELPVSMRVVQIEQVIFTLISNAMDALEELPSHSKKEILIEIFSENQFACIRVRDNGPGVPKAIKDQIMKPFFTTKSVGKGTGLGLSVAQDIIKSHKGEILLEATELGASFLIKLPINISTLERIQDIQLSDEPKAS
ncbi:MAG: GHKL domain-containing protein [Bdellovibrionales bacterium]|nr:GHKL domain-containing protein [Bdellovibrionales bacterium]